MGLQDTYIIPVGSQNIIGRYVKCKVHLVLYSVFKNHLHHLPYNHEKHNTLQK